jgi:hypothetical protein
MKTDPVGNLQWSKIYKDSSSYGIDGIVDKDGNIIVTGINTSIDSLSDVFIAKFDSTGIPLWANSYLPQPIAGNAASQATSIRFTSDSSYIVSVIYNSVSEGVLLKVDKNGIYQWATGYYDSVPGTIRPVDAEQTKEGGYILTGWVYTGAENLFLLKTDSTGIPEWMTGYNNGGFSRPYKVHQSYDGGYIVGGEYGGWSYFIKTDSLGSSGCNETAISTNYYSVPPDTHQVFLTDTSIVFTQSTKVIYVSPGPTLNTLCSSVGLPETQKEQQKSKFRPIPSLHLLQSIVPIQ